MHLAEEEITIALDDERIHMRPSLLAAARLERRHGGFPAIMRALGEGSVTVIADLIGECATARTDVPALLIAPGMMWRVAPLIVPLQAFTLGLMGYDPDAEEDQGEASDADARTTFAEAHARLYRIGTGWLGWSPADTLAASPAQIREAYKGRLELLRAVFGGGDAEGKPQAPASLDDKFAALIARNATLPGAVAA